jgi:hypothetical protein
MFVDSARGFRYYQMISRVVVPVAEVIQNGVPAASPINKVIIWHSTSREYLGQTDGD